MIGISRMMSSGKSYIPVVFLRHGQSTWNQQNIFIGMTDTPLTSQGVVEAKQAGTLLSEHNVTIDVVYTSLLRRSTKTVWLALQEMGLEWVITIKDWRLNERNYGALVGRNKKQCVEEFGKDQVKQWRRSWDTPPPPMSRDNEYYPYKEPRYQQLGVTEEQIPLSESLKDVTKRTSQFWDEIIQPQLQAIAKGNLPAGAPKNIMIVGHENNLRSIIKRLDGISNEDIINIELPRAIPLLFHLDPETFKPIKLEGAAQGLNGKYLCCPEKLAEIAQRDIRQVYDLSAQENLETDSPWAEKEGSKKKEVTRQAPSATMSAVKRKSSIYPIRFQHISYA